MEDVPPWAALGRLKKKCDEKEFFIALTDRITDKVSSMQNKLNRFKNKKKGCVKVTTG
jgi:hypothetical protein